MSYDGSRKRVERFLNNANRASDDFVAAVEAFLGDFQLIDYEGAAAMLSKLTRGPQGTPTEEDIARFAGVYHGEMIGLVTFKGAMVQDDEDAAPQRMWETRTLPGPAYPVFRMTPMANYAGLFVWAANSMKKPEDGTVPEDIQNVPVRGIASRFGPDYLMVIISEPYGSFYYQVKIAEDEPFTLYGYTSVPNILKVLNPLFLDDLREKLDDAGDNARKLLNLRNRMARIRVFDPACGSGNFLVIAYKEMRAIEAEINKRRGEPDRRTDIPLTNFRGIELRDFSAEVARLALIIAEYQCDVLYRGQREALRDFLPLDAMNWITCGNALRIDWLSICPPTGN